MALNVILLHYNNYYNRIVKTEETVADYKAADTSNNVAHYIETTGVNFVPGDGINTTLVVGTQSIATNDFDYLLVYDSTNEAIVSRWFILEEHRTRDGQFEIGLRRDVVADHLESILDSTTYVEKGYVASNDPLIFNQEGLLVNEIKQNEQLLKDASGIPWLIMYVGKDAALGDTTVNYTPADQNFIEVSASTIDTWQYSGYTNSNPFRGTLYNTSYSTYWQSGEWWIYNYAGVSTITGSGGASHKKGDGSHNWALRTSWHSKGGDMANKILAAYQNYGLSTFDAALSTLIGGHNNQQVNDLKYYNNKLIKTQDGKYYDIKVQQIDNKTVSAGLTDHASNLWNLMSNAVATSGAFTSGYTSPDNSSFSYSASFAQYIVTYTERTDYNVTAKISSTRTKTNDALYDIIAMPYGDITLHIPGATTGIKTNSVISMAAATALATALGGASSVATSYVYDLQLLPYCPIQSKIDVNGIVYTAAAEGVDFDFIKDNIHHTNIGMLFYVPNNSFTFDIDKTMVWDDYQVIDHFNDISILPLPYSSLQQNVDYVIPNMTKPSSLPYSSGTAQTLIRSLQNGSVVNGITFKKIDKKTGRVINTFQGAELILTYYSSSSIFTGGMISCGYYTGSGYNTPWQWTKAEYESGDFYLEFTLTTNSWGGTYVNEGIASASKIPVYDNLISESYAIKVDNECNKYRLVSPNYQGEFGFSVSKNGGVERFNVDCTYKPYQPYIHVNPNFKLMYGDDFNDSRGLICNGDFSVGMISDAFTNYELQNKNYNAIFNRQIQNMDVMNDIAKQEATFGMIGGTVKGAASGAITGAMVGGGYGAIAGAVIGGATSAVGGVMDMINLDKKITENRQYAYDMYNFSLQNIKALPHSMTRCTALTFNNKLFPFVETYSCTDVEKDAFILKLKYDGMTINKIGKIQDYTDMNGRMVKGEIIRYDESSSPLKADAHMANEIYNEIKKGVYI